MVFEPDTATAGTAFRPELVFDLEGNARAIVRQRIAHHGVVAAGEIVGVEIGSKAPSGGKAARVAAQHVDGIG